MTGLHNSDCVDCSEIPGNGIVEKIEGDPARRAKRSKEIPQVDFNIWKRL